MGCDIHMNVEARRDGRWRFVEPPTVHESWNPRPEGRKTWWDDRSYIVFSVLAGVRADEGDPEPISEPRGYPDDADPITLLEEDNRGQDHGDHSHSWLRLDEVLAYRWQQSYWESGVVGLSEYLRYRQEKSVPRQWARAVGGLGIHVMTPRQYRRWSTTAAGQMYLLDALVNGPDQRSHEIYIDMRWRASLAQRCESFLTWIRELPLTIGAKPEDIRLIFSFDS